MRRSHVISTAIDCAYAVAYAYLSNPVNFGKWAGLDPGTYRSLGDGLWAGATAAGQWRYRFTPVNAFGVLDHEITLPDGAVVIYPMRVVANQDGCEVQFTYFAHRTMDETEFRSTIEWIELDFNVLKTLLEAKSAG